MVMVDRTNIEDRLEELDIFDGKPAGEASEEPVSTKPSPKKPAAKSPDNSKKRKKSKKDSSELEDEEEEATIDEDSEEESDEHVNGKRGSRTRGKNTKIDNNVKRGRGRPAANKSSQPTTQGKAGKRGRPRKS